MDFEDDDGADTFGRWRKCNSSESGSWLSNGLAAGAGFLGGYFMGSRNRTCTSTFGLNDRSNTWTRSDCADDHSSRSSSSSTVMSSGTLDTFHVWIFMGCML